METSRSCLWAAKESKPGTNLARPAEERSLRIGPIFPGTIIVMPSGSLTRRPPRQMNVARW